MTVRIGFVGTGGIANHHLRTLAQLDEAELVAFCDVVEEKALAAASEYGGRAYGHYEALYDSESTGRGLYLPAALCPRPARASGH